MGRIDRRAARTRKALHQALIALILEKGYEAITVQEIIDADVGRSTFYAHYTSKEDLLRSGSQKLRGELADAERAARQQGGEATGEPLAFSRCMFEHAARYAEVYRALVGGGGGMLALNEIRAVLADFVQKELADAPDDPTMPRQARVQFVVGTFLTMLTWWLERSPERTPAEVDAKFRRLTITGIGTRTQVPERRSRSGLTTDRRPNT
jgi:AcrR family transcriptional regulator